ncbi:MAG: hypothetical protein DDT19_01099 [Syntrophomonadaceae bacterium]|nr:hypothetical protein [Bacillota bacterium]
MLENQKVENIKVHCVHDALWDVEKLILNPRNSNILSQRQIEFLVEMIKSQGWRVPIVISKRSGFVVRGHARLLAAKALGLSKVPVDVQDYDTEAEEWADLTADKRLAELSTVDKIAQELDELLKK